MQPTIEKYVEETDDDGRVDDEEKSWRKAVKMTWPYSRKHFAMTVIGQPVVITMPMTAENHYCIHWK